MVKITDRAKEKIISILNEDNIPHLRLGLQGGGCNGFSYFIVLETNKEDDDFEYAIDDVRTLLVDAASSMYLEDAEIDYKKDIMGESFTFNNPNVKTSCGCGSSVGF